MNLVIVKFPHHYHHSLHHIFNYHHSHHHRITIHYLSECHSLCGPRSGISVGIGQNTNQRSSKVILHISHKRKRTIIMQSIQLFALS
jgi:hypothetical protein